MTYVPQLPPPPQRLSNVVRLFPSTSMLKQRAPIRTSPDPAIAAYRNLTRTLVLEKAARGELPLAVVEFLMAGVGL
jgi:hypothetical protein